MAKRKRKLKRINTRVATLNLQSKLSAARVASDLDKVLSRGPGIVGLQESSNRLRTARLRKQFAKAGYGYHQGRGGNPIAFDLRRFKLVRGGSHLLSKRTWVGKPGAGGPWKNAKHANYVVLRDRRTGKLVTFTNVHLVASNRINKVRRDLHATQVRALANLQEELADRYPKAARILVGDMNTSNKALLAAVRRAGLNLHLPPKKSHRVGYIDWIASDAQLSGKSVLDGLYTDHNAVFGVFGNGGGPGKASAPSAGRPSPVTPRPTQPGQPPAEEDEVALSAFELFTDLLDSWGIPVGSDIEKIVRDAVLDGITPDQIHLIIPDIQQTQSWKTRFPGWHKRVANGFSQLEVGEYLALEDSYRRILAEAGIPAGFYDQPSDFGEWIAGDVSPDEIRDRVDMAMGAVRQVDATARDLLRKFYGVGPGDLASYFLDQKRAVPVLDRQYKAANVAAFAAKAGLQVGGARRYEDLIDRGVDENMAAQGYHTVAAFNDAFGRIAGVYGESYTQEDAEEDVFFNRSEKRRKLLAREAANFSGGSRGMVGRAQRDTSY